MNQNKEAQLNIRKVAMIGCGFVGSASAFSLMQSGLFSEMVLIDADQNRAEGEAMDISHGVPFAREMKIYAVMTILWTRQLLLLPPEQIRSRRRRGWIWYTKT